MKNIMNASYIDYTKDNELVDFSFYTNLRASEKVKFVNIVTNTLIGEGYAYLLRDIIFDYMIIRMFTDVDLSEIDKSSDSINRIEDLLESTNIVKIVKANVKDGLIDELNKAVDMDIEYRTGIHVNPLNDALASLIATIENKLSDIDTESMMELASMLSGITEELTPESIVKAYASSDVFKDAK